MIRFSCYLALLAITLVRAEEARPDFIATHLPKFYEGREFPGAKGSVAVSADHVSHTLFDFSGGGHYVETQFAIDPPQAIRTITFCADKSAGYLLTVRVRDASGQTFQKTVDHAAAGWASFRFDMSRWTGSWGGAGDGVLQQPVTGFSILVENTRQHSAVGELSLKDIVLDTYTDEERVKLQSRPSHLCSRYRVTDFGAGDINAFERRTFDSHPEGSLRQGVLHADFSKADPVSVGHSLAILGEPEELLLTVEADPAAAGAEFEIGIGSHFMIYTRTLGVLRKPLKAGQKIWQTFAIPAPPGEGWRWSGGANDGKARYPLRLSFIHLRKGTAQASAFAVRLVSLEATTRIRRAQALELRTRLLPNGERPAALSGELRNLGSGVCLGTLSVELKNWDGAVIGASHTNLAALLPGLSQNVSLSLPAIPSAITFAEAVTTFTSDDSEDTACSSSTWTAALADADTAGLRPDLPWGMGIYLYRNGWDEAGYTNMDRVASLAQAAGVKWSREEFQWHRMEPQRGTYDFRFYDRLVETASRHGISVYALVGYWTPWTKPYEEEGFKDYCAFLRVLVRRYKGRIKHWEIYNEPNIFFWSGPRERYPALLKMAYDAVKAEDAEAHVLGCSTAGIDTPFIQMCVDAQTPFDILTIHPYRAALHEETFVNELTAARKQVGGREVWITEMGWPTIPGNVSERQQAALLARSYLTAIGSGASHNICWYDFRNDGWNPYYNEENFGILHQDLVPKPAYRALAAVCRTFQAGKPSLTRVPLGATPCGLYLFRMGTAAAVWSDAPHATVEVKTAGTPVILNLMGEPAQSRHKNGLWQVETDALHPLFFRNASVEEVRPVSTPELAVPGTVAF